MISWKNNTIILLCSVITGCNNTPQYQESISHKFVIEEAKIEAGFITANIEYNNHVNRFISSDDKNKSERLFQDKLSIQLLTAVCQDNYGNRRVCFAQTAAGTQIQYHCAPTYDDYQCNLF